MFETIDDATERLRRMGAAALRMQEEQCEMLKNRPIGLFQGFPPNHWTNVLEVHQNTPRNAVQLQYRKLRSKHHPDKGGDARNFHKVEVAWENYKQANS